MSLRRLCSQPTHKSEARAGTAGVDLARRDVPSDPVEIDQPLTSVEAFALALVEASSRLTGTTVASSVGEAGALTVPQDDAVIATRE